jgi:ABC-2 type transport system ATP-binding protein
MIETVNLTKKYGKFTALDSLNLKVEKGTVFGFVGHNGAGKSTTFSILSTLLAPTSGTAYVNGYDVTENPKMVRKFIGYMPDFFGVYDQFRADEYLDFYGASYGIPYAYVDVLSRGMKQRLCLARALIHDPEVLILDEPASGLDPRARIEMREILRELKNMGKTIMISSHILPELAEMCDEIGVINGGKLVATGRVEQIHQQLQANKVLKVHVTGNMEGAIQFFEDCPSVSNIQLNEQKENLLSFSFEGTDEEQVELLKNALGRGIMILSFSQEESNLEDIFLEITKGVE